MPEGVRPSLILKFLLFKSRWASAIRAQQSEPGSVTSGSVTSGSVTSNGSCSIDQSVWLSTKVVPF